MCPNCNADSSKVILTRSIDDKVKIRRRVCNTCDHRWYTFQENEKVLPEGAIHWVGKRLQKPTVKPETPLI
ncbi:MAG: hypothetical protein ACO3N3_09195 [bacterium]